MKFVIGLILIVLLILAEVQKEKMTMLMSNNLVKMAMLLTIVFIFKTKNVVLGVISGLVFLCLLVMTSKPLQEGFNNHGESNSLDDEEHMHVVEKIRGKNRGKSCSNLKLVPYKKNQKHSKHEENESESEIESIEEIKHDKEGKPKSKTSRLCVEELLHKGNINSININFDRSNKGKEPVAVCPPGFKGPNKKGDCTARWYDGCGYECHKKKCEAYGGSFSDHDFAGNINYKCVPSMLSEFTDIKEKNENVNNSLHEDDKYSSLGHNHTNEFKNMREYTDEKFNTILEQIKNDTTPANVKTMPTESGRSSQSTDAEKARAEEERRKAEEEKGRCPSSHPNPYDGNGSNKGWCCTKSPISTGYYGSKLDNCNGGQAVRCTNPPCEPADNSMISTNARCGKEGNNKICPANNYCSQWGWCGTSQLHINTNQRRYNGKNTFAPWEQPIKNRFKGNNLCVDVPSSQEGVQASLKTCNNNYNQKFSYNINRKRLKVTSSGKCLGQIGGNSEGEAVRQWSCNDPRTKWSLDNKGRLVFGDIISGLPGRCLDLGGFDGKKLVVNTCNDSESQKWFVD